MPSSKLLKLSEVSSLIDQAYTLLEERKRLILLEISPSISDNQDLQNILNKTVKKLTYLEDDLIELINTYNRSNGNITAGDSQIYSTSASNNLVSSFKKKTNDTRSATLASAINKLEEEFNSKVFQYDKLLENIELTIEKESSTLGTPVQDIINIEDYKFVRKELAKLAPLAKSVRFKADLIETSPSTKNTPATFKPYTDEETSTNNGDKDLPDIPVSVGSIHTATSATDSKQLQHELEQEELSLFENSRYKDNVDSTSESNTENLSNRDIYSQQQQVLLQQDNTIDDLAASVRRQREMGYTINTELDSQMVILDDLEAQMDHSDRRLTKARKNLGKVNKKMREHGHCLTITVLVIILFVLVTVF